MIQLTERQLGYLAAMIDGEGTISITHYVSKSGRPRFQVRVSIYNSSKDLMKFIKVLLGGYVNHRRRDNGIRNWKDMYTWSVEAQRAKELLIIVEPVLIIKRRQAQLALEMLQTYMSKDNNVYGCNGAPDSLFDSRMKIKEQMHILNRKGRSIIAKGVNSEKPLLQSEVTPNQAGSFNSLARVETKGHPPKGMI